MRTTGRTGADAEEAVLRLVQEHAAELLRFAHRFSYCADDAHDAYQRSVEILVRRMRCDPPADPLPWIRTVIRHEALNVRAQRGQLVGRAEIDLDRHEDDRQQDPADRAVGLERLRHTAEALHRLKPQEVTALVLRSEGLSYKEICARTGWSYTRANRAITEGRRALRDRLGAIESGDECTRWLPLLSALADGEARASDLAALRPHLRRCAGCRATLREFHAAPRQVAALVPVAALPLAAASGGTLLGHVELGLHALAERATLVAMRVQGAVEALPGAKVAAVAASTAAIAGGGAAIEQATRPVRPAAAVAQAAAVSTTSAPARLPVPVAVARPPRTARAAADPARHSPPRAEFAPPRGASREFGADGSAERAAAPAPAAPPASAAAAAAAPGAQATPQFGPRNTPPAEFAGP